MTVSHFPFQKCAVLQLRNYLIQWWSLVLLVSPNSNPQSTPEWLLFHIQRQGKGNLPLIIPSSRTNDSHIIEMHGNKHLNCENIFVSPHKCKVQPEEKSTFNVLSWVLPFELDVFVPDSVWWQCHEMFLSVLKQLEMCHLGRLTPRSVTISYSTGVYMDESASLFTLLVTRKTDTQARLRANCTEVWEWVGWECIIFYTLGYYIYNVSFQAWVIFGLLIYHHHPSSDTH